MTKTELNPTIVIEPGTYRVAWVSATGSPPELYQIAGFPTLTGYPAMWLYAALTGHQITDPPQTATTFLARAARALIGQLGDNDQTGQEEDYTLARRVIQQWGGYIRPWLGVHYYDSATGQPVAYHRDYATLLDLHTGRPIPNNEQYGVVVK